MRDDPYRVAFIRVAQETNAFSKAPTTLEDFKRSHFLEGPALLQAAKKSGYEAKGWLRQAELSGFLNAVDERPLGEVAPQPLISMWAVPGGPLTRPTLDWILDRLRRGFRYMSPLNGVFISLHGAMGASGSEDPEVEILDLIRNAVGAETPVVATMDLHAQLTRPKMQLVDAVVGYRTNPHRDHEATGRRAGRLLLAMLRGDLRTKVAWRSLPMLIGGGTTIDFIPPMAAVYRRIRELEAQPGVCSISLFNGHLWYQGPSPGWSVVVIANGDQDLAERTADEVSELAWAQRNRTPPPFLDVEDAIDRVRRARLARALGTVCICDASDVVGAGAPGENTRLLAAFLSRGRGLKVYIPVRDEPAVTACFRRLIGDRLHLSIGGKFDAEMSPPLVVAGELLGKYELAGLGRVAVLAVDDARVVLTEGPPLATKPSFYEQVGLSPWRADAVIVKTLFPFRLYFASVNRLTIYVRTKGVSDLDLGLRMASDGPVHPRDAIKDWRTEDSRRRGLDLGQAMFSPASL